MDDAGYTERALDRIGTFSGLGDDWDGDGAKAIPDAAVQAATDSLKEFSGRGAGPKPTGIAPSPDGEVVIYWRSSTGYAEINFGNHTLTICQKERNDSMRLVSEDMESASNPDTSEVWKSLTEFMRGWIDGRLV